MSLAQPPADGAPSAPRDYPVLFANSWQRAWTQVSITEAASPANTGEPLRDQLLARYAEPHRHYHSQQHLAECLAAFDSSPALGPHPAEVEMALWFHDAVYALGRHDNEQQSADWAHQALQAAGLAADAAQRIHRLIMATRHDAAPVDADAQWLVDIDLAILGAAPARFAEYEVQIRREYSFVPGWLFKRKRRAVLAGFLDRPQIYSTRHFHERFDARARENLARAVGR